MSDRRAQGLAEEPETGSTHAQGELFALRKLARAMARDRKERPSSVHLLAAVVATPGPARELMLARRVDEERLLAAARSVDETLVDPLGEALAEAREFVRSRVALSTAGSQSPRPGAVHVLVALLAHRKFAAHRVLAQCGIDVARLRTVASRVVYGTVHPPRQAVRPEGWSEFPGPAGRPTGAATVGRTTPPPAPTRTEGRRNPKAVEVAWIPSGGPSPAPGRPLVSPFVAPRRDEVDEVQEEAPGLTTPRTPEVQGGADRLAGAGLELEPEGFPLLTRLGYDLTAASARGELDPVIGRSVEIERALDVLAKRHGNNPLLVGVPGVGKTTVARGLAARLRDEGGLHRSLVELPVGELLSGTGTRGALAERIADLRAELVRAEGRVVLFVDEIHELFAAAADEAMSELKSALAAGEFPVVGATTPELQRKLVESDPALARRFSIVEVEPPTEAEAVELLTVVGERLALHHGARFPRASVEDAVRWSVRYVPGRALPDKALAILDLAGARVSRRAQSEAATGRRRRLEPIEVDSRAVAEIVSEMAEVPLERLLESDGERMRKLELLMAERVVGHGAACARIASVLRRNAAGLRGRRPIGSFLLLGTTGVGKTETAKAVAEILFHSPDAMTRLDMSEYAEAHAVARLVGAPPGYVGHEAGGVLTEAVRRRPYQVLLLDEIEKAHRDVLEAFLQVFDEGRLTDGRGRTVDFTNTVIVLTSNLGAEELRGVQNERRVGFASAGRAGPDGDRLGEVAVRAARSALPPELFNRFDEVLFFAPLGRSDVATIARRMLAELVRSLASRRIELRFDDEVVEALLERGGYEPELGARPMRRTIARLVEAPLADRLLAGDVTAGSAIRLRVAADGTLALEHSAPARARGRRDGR